MGLHADRQIDDCWQQMSYVFCITVLPIILALYFAVRCFYLVPFCIVHCKICILHSSRIQSRCSVSPVLWPVLVSSQNCSLNMTIDLMDIVDVIFFLLFFYF